MTQPTPRLSVYDGRVVCTSENVAECFNRPLIDLMKRINTLPCTPEFRLRHYAAMKAVDGRGKEIEGCRMTREGFSFFAMSFVGKMDIKEAYLNAFRTQELQQEEERKQQQALIEKNQPKPDTPLERLEHIIVLVDQLLDDSTKKNLMSADIRVELAKEAVRLGGIKLPGRVLQKKDCHDVAQFWKNVNTIGERHLNHSRKLDQIAINLKEYDTLRRSQDLPGISLSVLQSRLRMSQTRPLIKLSSIRSCRPEFQGKTVQCWIFHTSAYLVDTLTSRHTTMNTDHKNQNNTGVQP